MDFVIFTHPYYSPAHSMQQFCSMVYNGLLERGNNAVILQPYPVFYQIPLPESYRKWLGYIDQYIIFPIILLTKLHRIKKDTVFVFLDQALGLWIPLVSHRPHIVHVHDFIALRSALNEFNEAKISWTGKCYQYIVKWGFKKGKNFISVSNNTKTDLHRFLRKDPPLSEVIYNGLHFPFFQMHYEKCIALLKATRIVVPQSGFLLHVGSNAWYKNRQGVLEIYKAYVSKEDKPLPLWIVGAPPTPETQFTVTHIPTPGEVRFFTGLNNECLCAMYSLASLLIFPSIAEGFGWPIAEAMACGCTVLTTGEPPMTEVGGDAAFYLPRRPCDSASAISWASDAADQVIKILSQTREEYECRRQRGFEQVKKFDTRSVIENYERIYKKVLEEYKVDNALC